jgi:hypothetical protein
MYTLIVLSRYGDILNCLPIAYALHKRGAKVRWLVSKEHASILSGVSYVEVEEWPGTQDTLHKAIHYVRSKGQKPLVAQAWKNPDQQHLTDSFAKEQWRLAGMQDHYGRFPLVIDRRVAVREEVLVRHHIQGGWERREMPYDQSTNLRSNRPPIVLVSTTSVSTPYKYADKLIATIRGLDAHVIDMDHVRVSNVYDLLGLYERADCLVSVDTMHHHLARASYLPVVYLQNDGWKGASPVPQVRASWRYSDIKDLPKVEKDKAIPPGNNSTKVVGASYPAGYSVQHGWKMAPGQKGSLHDVADAVRRQIERTCDTAVVVFPTYLRDGHSSSTERHLKARESHPTGCALYVAMTCRPKVKELLEHGLSKGKDVVILTNDDVTFNDQTLPRILDHARKWDFGCSRRPEDPIHVGREIFWWRSDWLKAHLNEFPDCYWTLQRVDLILAKWMRNFFGIPTTNENLYYDFPPVEIPAGLIYHEKHESHWNAPEIFTSPESVYNDNVWNAMV